MEEKFPELTYDLNVVLFPKQYVQYLYYLN